MTLKLCFQTFFSGGPGTLWTRDLFKTLKDVGSGFRLKGFSRAVGLERLGFTV